VSAAALERITWSLYCPFPKVAAAAEFSFAEKGRSNGQRYPKLKGSTYQSNRYEAPIDAMSLDLGTDDFLTFRVVNFEQGAERIQVMMGYSHVFRFVEGLQDALEMVRDGCFEESADGYVLTEKGKQDALIVDDLIGVGFLAFAPTVFVRSERDLEGDGEAPMAAAGEPGMRMYIKSWDYYSDVRLSDYTAFVEFFMRFDLFATSRAAVQVAVAQMGGVPGVMRSRAPAEMPQRKAGTLGGLAGAKTTLAKR
jgi:hypothetical protein